MTKEKFIYKRIHGNDNDLFAVSSKPKKMPQTGMFFCLEGEIEVVIDNKEYLLRKNSMTIYYPYSLLKVVRRSENLEGLIMAVEIDAIIPIISKFVDIDSILKLSQNPTVVLNDNLTEWMKRYVLLFEKHLEMNNFYAEKAYRKLWQLNHLQLENVKATEDEELAEHKIITEVDLQNCTLVNIKRGVSEINDRMQDDLMKIGLSFEEVEIYSTSILIDSLEAGKPVVIPDCWKDLHPKSRTIPFVRKYEYTYGFFLSKSASSAARKFLAYVKAIIGIQ